MASMSGCISIEKTNFLRFGLAVLDVSPNALRTFFDSKHPNLVADLAANRNRLRNVRIITTVQWNLLYPTTGKVIKINRRGYVHMQQVKISVVLSASLSIVFFLFIYIYIHLFKSFEHCEMDVK